MEDGLKLDVAVIGAGMSGLYTAWRLSGTEEGQNPKKVQIFELSNRIGGRIHSVTLPGMTVTGELGAMRYLDGQDIVRTLIEMNFGDLLDNVPFDMGDSSTRLVFYGRKQRCFQDDWTNGQKNGIPFQSRYAVSRSVLGFSADQMFNKVICDVLMGDGWFRRKYRGRVTWEDKYNCNVNITAEEWNDIKPKLVYRFKGPYNGLKVNSLGFWNVIKHQLGEEAYEFLSDAGGYYSNTGSCNAAEAFPNMISDFTGSGTAYKTIDGGYDKIAYAIAEKYLREPDAKIWIENPLETLEKEPEGNEYRYKLNIRNIEADEIWTVYTNAIVLAMPPRSLEILDQNNFFFKNQKHSQLQRGIESVIRQPSLKLLMGFEKSWWADPNNSETNFGPGHSITDLPVRQCYYFGKDNNNGHALFLATYNDMRTVEFWQPLEPAEKRECFTPTETSHVLMEDLAPYIPVQATKAMVEEALNQIREMHGLNATQIPKPYISWFKDWSQDPFGAGYHFWKAGVDVGAVMSYMRQPLDTEAVHICGEAFSDQQGWVEGALTVAERMLEEHFNLTRPDWLDSDYYLGW